MSYLKALAIMSSLTVWAIACGYVGALLAAGRRR